MCSAKLTLKDKQANWKRTCGFLRSEFSIFTKLIVFVWNRSLIFNCTRHSSKCILTIFLYRSQKFFCEEGYEKAKDILKSGFDVRWLWIFFGKLKPSKNFGQSFWIIQKSGFNDVIWGRRFLAKLVQVSRGESPRIRTRVHRNHKRIENFLNIPAPIFSTFLDVRGCWIGRGSSSKQLISRAIFCAKL